MVGLKKLNLKDYKNTIIPLDNIDYHIFYKRNISGNIDAPRIMIVSYQPNPQASKITRMAIETIRKFTDSDSVSYTHLDVYKRQVYRCGNSDYKKTGFL